MDEQKPIRYPNINDHVDAINNRVFYISQKQYDDLMDLAENPSSNARTIKHNRPLKERVELSKATARRWEQ